MAACRWPAGAMTRVKMPRKNASVIRAEWLSEAFMIFAEMVGEAVSGTVPEQLR